jgi:O-antigen ligase
MMSLPFLQPVRAAPIIPFYSEWLAIVLGLGAGMAFLAIRFWDDLFAPKITLYLLGLMTLISIQYIFIKPAYPTQTLLPLLYLAWTVVLAVLVTWLREQLGLEAVLRVLAYFLLIGGLLHALFGISQYLGLYGWLGGLIESRKIVSIAGNIGQQNHFATHIMLATLALSYLFAMRHLSWILAISVLTLLTFALALSGSRSVALYAIGASVLSLLFYRKKNCDSHYRLAWLNGLLLVIFLIYQYSLPWLNESLKALLTHLGFDSGHLEILTATQRGATNGIEQRLVEWYKAWLMFLNAPLLGIGIGNYAWHSFVLHGLPEIAEAHPKSQLYHHAHNFFLEFLAGLGISGLLLLLLLMITWLKQFLKTQLNTESWFIAAVLLVLFIHGNLEYPFWYSYFLGILAIFLALGDNRKIRINFTPKLGQIGSAASLILLFGTLAITFLGYRQLTDVNALILMQSPTHAANTLRAISTNVLLTPWAEAVITAHGSLDKNKSEQQLTMMARVMQHQPDHVIVYRQIVFFAMAGKKDDALSLLGHFARAYSPVFHHYLCRLKKTSGNEISPLVAEGEKILGKRLVCQYKDHQSQQLSIRF